MSTISDKVIKVAQLAKLALTNDEVTKFAPQLDTLLAYLENLKELNTTMITPTRQVTGLHNISRPDTVMDSTLQAQLLDCSPLAKDDNHLVVPSVFA